MRQCLSLDGERPLSKLGAARAFDRHSRPPLHYYRIASPLGRDNVESMKVVAAIEVPPRRQPRSANDDALRFAGSCYEHLAGQVGRVYRAWWPWGTSCHRMKGRFFFFFLMQSTATSCRANGRENEGCRGCGDISTVKPAWLLVC